MAALPSNLVIIGTGRVAEALIRFLSSREGLNICVIGRNSARLKEIQLKYSVEISENLNDSAVEWAIVAISDDALKDVISNVKAKWISITAGTADWRLYGENCSILYPLQSFSANADIQLENIPFIIDGDTSSIANLEKWTDLLSLKAQQFGLEKREKLHVVAVFLNNFVHHIMAKGIDLAKNYEINPEIFEALISETFNRFDMENPYSQQTGPAERKDEVTIEKHRKYLSDGDLSLYNILSISIKATKDAEL
ncbi:MAG: DUF2520 domain-containing protein [Crocinitomicaceae bacterium]